VNYRMDDDEASESILQYDDPDGFNKDAPDIFCLNNNGRVVLPTQLPFSMVQINANKIISGIFIGNQEAAQEIEFISSIKCSHIINCAGHSIPNLFVRMGIKYLTLRWLDCKTQILFPPNMKTFRQVMRFIESAVSKGQAVLVHSQHGNSRAVCVITAYLMYKYGWSATKSIEYIRFRRPEIQPKPYFVKQMRKLAKRLKIRDDKEENIEARWLSKCGSDKELIVRNTFLNGHYIYPPTQTEQDSSDRKEFKLRFKEDLEEKPAPRKSDSVNWIDEYIGFCRNFNTKSILKTVPKGDVTDVDREVPSAFHDDASQTLLSQYSESSIFTERASLTFDNTNRSLVTSPSPRENEESQPENRFFEANVSKQHSYNRKAANKYDPPIPKRNATPAWTPKREKDKRYRTKYKPKKPKKYKRGTLNSIEVIGINNDTWARPVNEKKKRRKKCSKKQKKSIFKTIPPNSSYKKLQTKVRLRTENTKLLHQKKTNVMRNYGQVESQNILRGRSLSRAESADNLVLRMKKMNLKKRKKKPRRPSSANQQKKRHHRLADPGIMVFGKIC